MGVGPQAASVIVGATRAVDGHRLIPSELDPPPIVAFLERPTGSEGWVVGDGACIVSGWAASARGRTIRGVLRLGDGTDRAFACDVPRPDVVEAFDLESSKGVVVGGFEVPVALSAGLEILSARIELSDGEYIADAPPLRIRRHRAPEFRRDAPTTIAPMAIFDGEWRTARVDGDELKLADARLDHGVDALGGVANRRVLDLASGEGCHSAMLERLGAAEVVGVEGDPASYVRALVLKEVAGLRKTTFLFGDPGAYLRTNAPQFDLAIAIDVLHHQLEPVAFLEALSPTSDRLVLWVRHFDGPTIDADPCLRERFARPPVERDLFGRQLLVHRFEHDPLDIDGFTAGPDSLGGWMERDDLIACLELLGFAVEVPDAFDRPDDSRGPSMLVVATR